LPSAAANTTRARVTIRCSLVGERTTAKSDSRSSPLNSIPTATNGIIASKLDSNVEPGFASQAGHSWLCTETTGQTTSESSWEIGQAA
jgi:hypothetical protein